MKNFEKLTCETILNDLKEAREKYQSLSPTNFERGKEYQKVLTLSELAKKLFPLDQKSSIIETIENLETYLKSI